MTRPDSALRVAVVTALGLIAANPPSVARQVESGERLTLHDAVRRTLNTHPGLRAADAARDQAASALGEARAARLPGATTEASVTRFEEPMIIAPLHEFNVGAAPEFSPTLVQNRLTVAHTLFDGGLRGARVGQAQALEAAATAAAVATRMELIERAATAYLDLLTALGVDGAVARRVAALEAERERVSQLHSSGRAAWVEVLRADAALAQSRAERISAQGDLEVARGVLARLTGLEVETVLAARLAGVTASPSEPDPSLLERARSGNPDLERARHRARAEHAALRAARADWFPTVRLAGGYVAFGSAAGHFTVEWQGGVTLSYPLFAGGSRSRRVARAGAQAERADAEVAAVELVVDEAVDRAGARLREAEARGAALTAAVDHWSEVVRIEQLALTAGAGVQTDYLTAEAELFQARAALARARHAHVAARIGLARTVGELSEEWLAAHVESP